MQMLTLSDHFSTPGMVTATVLFVLFELLSVIATVVLVHHYRHVTWKHGAFLGAIERGTESVPEKRTGVLLWIYIILTIAFTLFTIVLFLFQPHLY